jgi:hypothetical protein
MARYFVHVRFDDGLFINKDFEATERGDADQQMAQHIAKDHPGRSLADATVQIHDREEEQTCSMVKKGKEPLT